MHFDRQYQRKNSNRDKNEKIKSVKFTSAKAHDQFKNQTQANVMRVRVLEGCFEVHWKQRVYKIKMNLACIFANKFVPKKRSLVIQSCIPMGFL